MFAQVALNLPYPPGGKTFTYAIPPDLTEMLAVGMRVLVPYGRGNKALPAIVVAVSDKHSMEAGVQIKAIMDLLDQSPVLSPEQLALGLWTAKRFLSPIYLVFEAMLPAYIRQKLERVLVGQAGTGNLEARAQSFLDYLQTARTEKEIRSAFPDWQPLLASLEEEGLVHWRWQYTEPKEKPLALYLADLSEEAFKLAEQALDRAPRQQATLLALFTDGPQTAGQLRQRFGGTDPHASLSALIKKGYVRKEESYQAATIHSAQVTPPARDITLSEGQTQVMATLERSLQAGVFASFLLQGITGSGKTEIYIRSVAKVLAKGEAALVLIPEISLTKQMLSRFAAQFPDDIAILHSGLTDKERYQQWREIKVGKRRIVIGTRSAVFAPLDNLGLVIIDEGHDGAYKQTEPDPRYHAHTVAEKRAQMNQALFISGSATPSVDLAYRADTGSITRLTLHERAGGANLPTVQVCDLRRELDPRQVFSDQLIQALRERLALGDQALLYMNRRGYATALVCDECGEAILCPHCDVALTYHKNKGVLRCHYCDFVSRPPTTCPNCQSDQLSHQGMGTEQIEQAFHTLFPQVKTARLDSDTSRNQGDILRAFQKGEAQVLVGTQMIAKGLDFPNITLTGVLNADLGLYLPDYRAAERTFQELTQVAGRAGRGDKPGLVIFQTRQPDHPALVAASVQDYDMFYNHEIEVRRMIDYPPFTHLMQVVVSAGDRLVAEEAIQALARDLKALTQVSAKDGERYVQLANDPDPRDLPDRHLIILGPSPAPLEKVRNRWRYQMILKAGYLPTLLTVGIWCRNYRFSSRKSKSLRLTVDVDPENIL
ncbi:primosomal protein N' [Peptococcus simiae]|uniref:replication restart helicase PriA n=1 Tax=Peptococcus simiae TaxID=1643805 RepID=UPI00397F3060